MSAGGFEVTGDLTSRGVTRPVVLEVSYLGQWDTPWWEGGQNRHPHRQEAVVATAVGNGVSVRRSRLKILGWFTASTATSCPSRR